MRYSRFLTATRNRHFMDACRTVIATATGPVTSGYIARKAAAMPAPGYYVSFDYALRVLRYMRRSGFIPREGKGAGALWRELCSKVTALQQRHRIPDSEALSRVLADGKASSFFIRPATALRLYHRLKHTRSTTATAE